MTSKTVSMISYITIIGWAIAFSKYKNGEGKSSLSIYHLKQSLGVFVVSICITILIYIIASFLPTLASILSLGNLAILIFWIFGIINASNELEKPVPIIGSIFENKFNFIK